MVIGQLNVLCSERFECKQKSSVLVLDKLNTLLNAAKCYELPHTISNVNQIIHIKMH